MHPLDLDRVQQFRKITLDPAGTTYPWVTPIQSLGMEEVAIAATIAGHVRSSASFRHCFLHWRWMVERQVELCEDVVDGVCQFAFILDVCPEVIIRTDYPDNCR